MKKFIVVLSIIIFMFVSISQADESLGGISEDTLVYYYPVVGQYYHLNPKCRIPSEYPQMESYFKYSERVEAPYCNLLPCEVCTTPLEQEDGPLFSSFGEVSDENRAIFGEDFCIAIVKKEGQYYRVVTKVDEKAKALLTNALALENEEECQKAINTYIEYCKALPIYYDEVITAVPLRDEELKTLEGKSLEDMLNEGYDLYVNEDDENAGDDVITFVKDFYEYMITIIESQEESHNHDDGICLDELIVEHAEFLDFSDNAFDICYRPDGTWIQPEDIGIDIHPMHHE
ncbi:hypothetical protein SAMN06297421_104196 [Aristaeella hokkaidonensis]|nr:hypothetical protein [Aristaeella hokkaidonensis]SNT94224.1 hypothetical protein SAMN06297421_104196 [Aristaeella hokkaidonensis]